MSSLRVSVVALSVVVSAAVSVQADWPGWRGPLQNGVQPGDAQLLDAAPETLPLLWKSGPVPADQKGGFASPTVAGGKAFVFSSWRKEREIAHRTLRGRDADRLGRAPKDLPEALHAAIETARLSEDRQALPGKEAEAWAREWVKQNLADEAHAPFRKFAEDRIKRGADALGLTALLRSEELRDKPFADAGALEAWLAASELPEADQKRIRDAIPTKETYVDDAILCLDAATGEELWRTEHPSAAGQWGSSSTPLVQGGRLFVAGARGTAYCLDVETGAEIWNTSIGSKEVNASFAAAQGLLFIQAGRLVALRMDTGELAWEQKAATGADGSPVVWIHEGVPYIITGGKKTCCVRAADGEVVWTVEGGQYSTPAVAGATLAVQHDKGLRIYRISPTGAELVVENDAGGSRGGSAVTDGTKVWSNGRKVVCLDAVTGAQVWEAAWAGEDFSSPILSNGRLLCLGKDGLYVFDAATGDRLFKAKVDFVRCSSGALVGSRLYLRAGNDVRCYELGKAS